jgi:hypothetical protein
MKIVAIVFLLFILAFGVYGHKTNISPKRISRLSKPIDTSKYVILKFDKENTHLFNKNVTPATLSSEEIEKIESLISTAVTKHNKKFGKYSNVENPSKYYKQFIAVINSTGEKEVWINCRCSIQGIEKEWKNDVVSTFDGGPCYFNLKINLNENTVFDLMVNNYD